MGIRNCAPLGFIVVACVALWSISAAAQDPSNKEALRVLAKEADAAFNAGQYDVALDKFQRAYQGAKVPSLAVCVAKTQAKLGHLVLAYETYREATYLQKNGPWDDAIQQQAQQEAQQQLTALQARLAYLTVRIDGAPPNGVTVEIDRTQVPANLVGVQRPVDPGQRLVVVRASELELDEQVALAEGEHKELLIKLAQPPTTRSSTPDSVAKPGLTGASRGNAQENWGWLGVGVGAAGLALGATTGIIAMTKHSQLSSSCPNGHCPPDKWAESGGLDTWRHVSTVGFVAGAIGTAAGVTLLLTNPNQPSKPSVGLWLAPATTGVRGAF